MSKKIKKASRSIEDKKFPLPVYKKEEDIYYNEKGKTLDEENNYGTGKHAKVYKSQDGELDIPGSELDDANEEIGEEDEENNYYSLGGDDHEDLEADQGD